MTDTKDMMSREEAEKKLDEMITKFGNKNGPELGKQLKDLIDTTPDLREKFVNQVQNEHLTGFKPVPPGSGRKGAYDIQDSKMEVAIDTLNSAAQGKKESANELRTTFGHEITHAAECKAIVEMYDTREDELSKVLDSSDEKHDYTAPLEQYNKAKRVFETRAEIAGFNTLAAYVKKQNPNATLGDLYRAAPEEMKQYIDVDKKKEPAPEAYALKAGLTVDENLKMPPEAKANFEAMEKYYYDKKYASREIGDLLETIARIDNTGKKITVDLHRVGAPYAKLPPGITDTSQSHTPRSLPSTPFPGRQGKLESHSPVTQTASASFPPPTESRFRSPSLEDFFNGDPGKAARDFAQTANLEQFKVNNQQASADIAVQGGQGNNQPQLREEPKKLAESRTPSEEEQGGMSL